MNTCKTDDCDRPVFVKKTGECKRCYNRRYYREHPTQWQAPHAKYLCNPPALGIGPCGYQTAHNRVKALRGPAHDHACICGQPAEEWSYRGGSPWEQTGTKPSKNGKTRVVVSWSSHPGYYDPLCRPCHNERDGRPRGTSIWAAARRRRHEGREAAA